MHNVGIAGGSRTSMSAAPDGHAIIRLALVGYAKSAILLTGRLPNGAIARDGAAESEQNI